MWMCRDRNSKFTYSQYTKNDTGSINNTKGSQFKSGNNGWHVRILTKTDMHLDSVGICCS